MLANKCLAHYYYTTIILLLLLVEYAARSPETHKNSENTGDVFLSFAECSSLLMEGAQMTEVGLLPYTC